MSDFRITYDHPRLLLIFIPALLLTLIPYFRLNRRYRSTRNKIISMTVHTVAMLLAVNLLAGVALEYEIPNEENEVILLVDVSDSGRDSADVRDEFLRTVIDVCDEGCRLGIVKFGYGCSYSVALTSDRESVYGDYLSSEDPDGSATALADALRYAGSLFTSKECSKIVVVSDGLETDGDALLALNELISRGTVVDSLILPEDAGGDIRIASAKLRSTDIAVAESFTVDLVICADSVVGEEAAMLRLYDNGELLGERAVALKNGVNELPVSVSVPTRGMHELTFELVTDHELFGEPLPDKYKENNSYRTYVNFQAFENVLLIERHEGEADRLKYVVSSTKELTDISVEKDIADFPTTIGEMAEYEQIILVNIAYSDMPGGFEALLNRYVYELGGGLFTVGGRCDTDAHGNIVPHAYNRADLERSEYLKHMLPVTAEDYTPPIAVMLVIDTSLSMKSTGKLSAATDGARACLDALHDRDFCGVVSFSSASSERLSVLPVSQRETISEAIKKVEEDAGGGTIFSDAIMKAGRALSVISNVERKHIILITDGLPADSFDDYGKYIEDNIADGITMSVLTIGIGDEGKRTEMQMAADAAGGKFYNVTSVGAIADMMYKDLTEEAIPEIAYGRSFALTVKDKSSILSGIDKDALPTLSGYYGTVAKKGATVPLMGEYVPIYAFHKYGKGTVGSFMCDLGGVWSAELLSDPVGEALITNIVESIFPKEDVRADGIIYELQSDNYLHWINIHGIPEGQTVGVSVHPFSEHLNDQSGELGVTAAESNRRFTFRITEPGLYEIRITAYEGEKVVSELSVMRAFSYSEEYGAQDAGERDGAALLRQLAEVGGGVVVDDPVDVFTSLEDTLVRRYDPKVILIIAAIVLVLIDIAVRKFKFKWLHEIIRERRNEKQ